MNEEEIGALSIIAERSRISLEETAAEKVTSLVKAGLGSVPGIGSLLQEALTVAIPNQRMDRVVTMLEIFASKVEHIEDALLASKITSEKFYDLLEEAIPQAARALSNERLEYIAAILKNSLTEEELDIVEEKKILSILGELNDAEIILLRHESLRHPENKAFYLQHQRVLQPPRSAIGSPRGDHDKSALHSSFKSKLFDLGLMENRFPRIEAGKLPEFDRKSGTIKAQNASLTQLGRLLLRRIDHPASSDRAADEFEAQREQVPSIL